MNAQPSAASAPAPLQAARRIFARVLPRTLLEHPRVEPRVAAVLRSTVVHETPTFALRELAGRRGTRHVYRIRENGLQAEVAHRTADVHALDQAFYQHAHEPPPGALAALQGLGRPLRALDLGANIGMWGLWLHGRFLVAHVTALEPDPDNVARHRRQIELNALQSRWEVIEAAAVTADGPVFFTVGQETTGRVAEAAEDDATSVAGRDTFALLQDLDLLKLDIEGGEWAILADPRAAALSAPVVMLEYHAHNAPSADPHADAHRLLQRAGYLTETALTLPGGFGVMWGHKTDLP
jgi:FkbM family methyltransferase